LLRLNICGSTVALKLALQAMTRFILNKKRAA
jgi:hypothetical protein